MERGFHIILNYRREDTSAHAGRLYDDLADHFGGDHVFMDIDTIEPGVDFAEVIERAVGSASVFLSLIGQRWLTAVDAKGERRLDKPDDFVRLEIEAALRPEVRVIPILVQNATMPSSTELPPSLAPLARRNAMELRDNSWRYDVGRLIETIDRTWEGGHREPDGDLGAKPVAPGAPRRRFSPGTLAAWIVAGLALAVAIGLGVSQLFGSDEPEVRIRRVDLEMQQLPASQTEPARNALVATAFVTFRHSAPEAGYTLLFTLETRDTPGGPARPYGSQDMTFVLTHKNDQCSCKQPFEHVPHGREYRVSVEVSRSNSSDETLADGKSAWVRS